MAASVELGCARTRYFNMLPSRLDGFGADNFRQTFFSFADSRWRSKKRLLKPETDNEILR